MENFKIKNGKILPPALMKPMRSNQSQRVLISGGGPVGLLLAIMLKELFYQNIAVIIFDGRWKQTGKGITWKSLKDGNNRRSQVITLQSRPLAMLPPRLRKALLPVGGFSEIWPYSEDSPIEYGRPKNICIQDIENRLLSYAQKMGVELMPEKFYPEKINLNDYDILAICEGAGSKTRDYFKNKFGAADPLLYSLHGNHLEDVVLGLQVKSGIKSAEAVVLTIIQNRFLLNINNDGYGHLNMRLCKEEANEFQKSHDIRSTFLWPRILQGLKLFDIGPENLMAIKCFNVSMKHRGRFSAILGEDAFDKPTYGFLLGDAANAIHLWPGRGLNQGFVSAISLAHCLHERWRSRLILREADFSKHEAIMHMLQYRHKTRAWHAMTQRAGTQLKPISELIAEGLQQPLTNRAQLLDELLSHSARILSRLQSRLPELPSQDAIGKRLELLNDESLSSLVASKPWETFLSGGAEVDLGIFYPQYAGFRTPNSHYKHKARPQNFRILSECI